MLYQVFVYGTLLVGEANHHVVEPYLISCERGHVKGRLYDVGDYPALVLDEGEDEVAGEWLIVTEEGLRQMDLLEDFLEGRPNNEYERVWVKDSRRNIEGFVYVYSLEKAQHLPIIYSNSWREHRRNQK